MPYCTRCGKPIQEGEQCSCTKKLPQLDTSSFNMFMYSLGQRMGIGDPNIDPVNKYERGKKIVPDNITPNDSEIPVRQYNLCTLRSRIKFMRAEGRLQLTNKRILFRAKGTSLVGGTTLQYEFAIDEVAGFQIVRNFRFSILDLLIAILLCAFTGEVGVLFGGILYGKLGGFGAALAYVLAVLSIIPAFLIRKWFLSKSMLLGAGTGLFSTVLLAASRNDALKALVYVYLFVICVLLIIHIFVFSFKPNMEFHVRTKSGEAVIPVRCEKKGFGSFANSTMAQYTGYNEVLPTDETERAISEIGAMINDIQKMGDYGIAKWKTE